MCQGSNPICLFLMIQIVLGNGESISDLEDEILLEEELLRQLESKLNRQGGLRRLQDSNRRNFRNKYVLNHISRLKGDAQCK